MLLLSSVSIPLVTDLTIIFCVAIIVILICSKLKLPSVVGFLITGVLCGTNGIDFHSFAPHLPESISGILLTYFPRYIAPPESDVEMLAEIGVVFLLFTIGLEFSIASLMRIKKAVFVGGALQVMVTVAVFALLVYYTSYDYWPIAIFMGMLFALSSTAIVLKILSEKGQIGQPHGQVVLAILIFQDIAIVPMMLLVPIMASGDFSSLGTELLMMAGKAGIILVIMFFLGKYVIPFLLFHIAKAKSDDLFIISIMVICFVIAYITSLAGLSLALGAFMAGLVISETQYGHHAIGSIISFKELFTSIFFISVGLLMDLSFVFAHFWEIVFFTSIVIVIKVLVTGLVVVILRGKPRTVVAASLGICQIGEFSFVLSKIGQDYGLMPIELYQYFLCVAVFSMIFTPMLMGSADKISNFLMYSKRIPEQLRIRLAGIPIQHIAYNVEETQLHDHLVILGFNITGQTLAHGAKEMGIPFVILEEDVQIVKAQSDKGIPIIYGASSSAEVLKHVNIEGSSAVILTADSLDGNIAIIRAIKEIDADAHILARAHTLAEASKLKASGAAEVLVDEVEMNISMLVHILDKLELPAHEAYKFASYIKTLENEAV